MKLTLGFSPCPNDTFIFDALVNGKIDTEGLEFDLKIDDVESLNKLVLARQLDISKISYGVLPLVIPDYRVLNSGGALGRGVGPLLIAREEVEEPFEKMMNSTVALPGKNTTAHLLYTLAFPQTKKKIFLPFHEIENVVLHGETDAGVIIHENRFTYQQKGLVKLADLGEIWEENTGQPIPLGGIVMNRELDENLMVKVNRLIRKSLEYAFANYPALPDFVKQHAQEMDEEVMRKHIDLYVNEFSLDLGREGKSAVWQLLEIASRIYPEPVAGSYEVFL